ncbi:MAG: ATP-dependent zinc metalloprotease FtsH [Victivallales bacterium]|nr:ATP-dependent zinc metalloprotease FtsH [Victivallales bacterium]MCF7888950.1 ATP-dependent zinc metalloprotease FtsH [Victivallales bacterium]
MDDKQKNNKFKPTMPGGKKPVPIALIIWFLIFATAISFFLFSTKHQKAKQLDQGTFERELVAGNIKTVVLTPDTQNTMTVEGDYQPSNSAKDVKYQSRVIYSNSLDRLLRDDTTGKYKLDVEVKSKDTWFGNIMYFFMLGILPVVLLYLLFSRQVKSAGKGAMQFGKNKARMISPEQNKIRFDDVAGADEAKEETKEIMDYLKNPLKFQMLGAKIPKGAMLVGPPGTGKTMLAKAIAAEAGVPFFAISGSDFVEMFVGVGASRVRDMFEQARKCSPSLIFIDEIDAVGRSRFSGIGGGHDEREQTLNAMLVEMDGLETKESVIVLAATNRPDVLDPALIRPGRFDRQIVLDLPDINGRKQILQVHANNIKVDDTVDLTIIAKGTPGFSGADLANLINEAAIQAAKANRDATCHADMEEARDKVCWGRERRSRKISEKEKKITAYHESGHTLAQLYCEFSTPLHKVTIIPRGAAYLGATFQLSEEDRYTQNKLEMEDMMIGLMGGRSAEEIIFGKENITSGAAADIKQATKIAKDMVCSFGMSEKLGEIAYGSRDEQIYVGREITKSEDYSEDTARELDIEVRNIVKKAKNRAYKILEEHKDQLILLSETLLEKETMTAKDVKILLGMAKEEDFVKPPGSSLKEREVTKNEQKEDNPEKQTDEIDSSGTGQQKTSEETEEKKQTNENKTETEKKVSDEKVQKQNQEEITEKDDS